jgi:hypothetical protein
LSLIERFCPPPHLAGWMAMTHVTLMRPPSCGTPPRATSAPRVCTL